MQWLGCAPDWTKRSADGGISFHLLRGDLTDTTSTRGVYLGRTGDDELDEWRHNEGAQNALKRSIRTAIQRIYIEHEEVPLLGMYRKELMGELLALHKNDEPAGTEYLDKQRTIRNPNFGIIHASDRRARRWEALWAVQRLAQRWRVLQRLKEIRETTFQAAFDAATSAEDQENIQACIEALGYVDSMDSLNDVDAKFKLIAPSTEDSIAALDLEDVGDGYGNGGAGASGSQQASQGGGLRRRRRTNAREIAIRAGLGDASRAFALTASQFAENINAAYRKHEPLDPSVPPAEFAAQFVDPSQPARRDPDQVMRCVSMVLSAEIAAEPGIRRDVRDYYWKNAKLNTTVTAAGATVLTPFHHLAIAKRLRDKRLSSFKSDTFLRVLEAEKAGYIKVDIGLGDKDKEPIALDLFLSGGIGPEAQAWNEMRKKILEDAITNGIMPGVLRDLRARLTGDARAAVSRETSKTLWELAVKPPLTLRDPDHHEEILDKRIMGMIWGPGTPPTTLVILDPSGNMVDYLHCPQLSGNIPRPRKTGDTKPYKIIDDPKKGKDVRAIVDFIAAHQPHSIVIGVSHYESIKLYEDMEAIFEHILLDDVRVLTSNETSVSIVPSQETVAALWENSEAAKQEMPVAAPVVRRAVALARQALEPLAVLCSLCGPSREILSLQLNPLQACLGEDERMRAVEETLTTAVAQVGIDINAAIVNTWLAATLQFIPGLGPRKAQAFMRAVSRAGGFVASRHQICEELMLLGTNVFRNVGPYLKIRASNQASTNEELEPLDNTRIHPDSYDLAIHVATLAVNEDADIAVEQVLANPKDLERLNLGDIDDQLVAQDRKAIEAEEQGGDEPWAPGTRALRGSTRLSSLIDMRYEFTDPYGDLRAPMEIDAYKELWKESDVFYWAVGENRTSLKVGRRVDALIRFVMKDLVRVVIPELNNMEGIIEPQNVSSKTQDATQVDCREYFKQGNVVTAVITEIDTKTRQIHLGTSTILLNEDLKWETEYLKPEDGNFFIPNKQEHAEEMEEGRRKAAKSVRGVRRAIKHPLFKNLAMADAASALTARDGGPNGGPVPVGTAIVRPGKSARGLYLTVRLPENQVWHLGISEKGKPTADLRLAPPISIEPLPGKSEEFDDLDEFAARFVDPLASALRALVMHRKWRGGGEGQHVIPWSQIQEMLTRERSQAPNAAAYCLAADDRRPGAFYLGYCINQTPRREFFVVLPDGFYFRKKVFSTVDKMVNAFKSQPVVAQGSDRRPQQQQQRRQEHQPQQQRAPQVPVQQQYPQQYPTDYAAAQQYQQWYGAGGHFGATVEDGQYPQQQQYPTQQPQYPQQQYSQQQQQQQQQQQYRGY